MKRHMISVLVENNAGVLSRIAGLFSRRSYNIESLSVGPTQKIGISRMTISVCGDEQILEQIKKQLNKLIEVIKVVELEEGQSVYRELVMVKVKADNSNRSSIVEISNIFRANIIDISQGSLTLEMTGDEAKISAFGEMLSPFGIVEIVRTGAAALQRGCDGI
ncbi:acetolactate synthase, small subunit [Peptoclostridium litorale DSM 5388]|uniref:Acetolactate synthase small subunit n=1 Tax=Peptoclostridium litorale DSM 5388 TaxID=1121324 RepID=A0A069RHH2_PEPLI|nr:acetolactate synthase small subunit [Peptoclostridium litorale]KDR96466.1 putative acetolactate synthase small subunit IlvH [Peptoclostridium litorale DSM 5388]SIN70260.1 acetolactate synthase, small subunit [Peptoclostridium litorale DSM 5388]